jgi:hypothetical protein
VHESPQWILHTLQMTTSLCPFFILFNLCIFFVYGVMDSECEFMFAALAGKGVSKTSNIKVVLNGGQKLSFVRSDGSFAFQGVPAGTHLLEVVALGYFFSPVRVDVSSRLQGQVRASLVETGRSLPDSLVLEPLREEYYYEKREPFSAMGLLKSPMGLMIGFMVVCVFLLPKLMDQIDPEEMKRVQEEMRNKPSPLSNLLQGRT